MNNKKGLILTIIALLTLTIFVVGATYAYFSAQGGASTSADIKVTTSTTDLLTFNVGSDINIYADQTTFGQNKTSLNGTTTATATLTANNSTNNTTMNYYIYLNIANNNFIYTQNTTTPELILTINDSSNNEVTSIEGLTYYDSVLDNNGTVIKGFDITNKIGLLTLVSNHEITAAPSKEEKWFITVTFVNYDNDQTKNAGKDFVGQVIISKDSFDNYTPNTIQTATSLQSENNLTVNLKVDSGTNEIDKYYYGIKEKDGLSFNYEKSDTLKVNRLSNILANNTITYVESDLSSYTFTNIDNTKNYDIFAYAVDKNKIKTNSYEFTHTNSYTTPTISDAAIMKTPDTVTLNVNAKKGTNNIVKYLYSIDNGNSFIESTSNSYTFNNLSNETNYRILVKASDSDGNLSNVYVNDIKTGRKSITLVNYIKSLYTAQGENGLYYHDGTIENGLSDGSYRYAGAANNVNNYVCISNETVCSAANLFRIIGVFGTENHGITGKQLVKLIKASSIGDYSWDEAGIADNVWEDSTLNSYLNETYITALGDFANNIETISWKVGGISSQSRAEMYTKEIINSANTTVSAKIGLMYVSDYSFSSSSSENWLTLGTDEWLITPYTAYTGIYNKFSFFITSTGGIGTGSYVPMSMDSDVMKPLDGVAYEKSVRPTFYIASSLEYSNGSGTQSDPYRLS